MRYQEAIQSVDTDKALALLGIKGEQDGSYLKFIAPCGHKAIIRLFGDKKNVIYCPECKKGSNIFQLALDLKGINYADLVEKTSRPSNPIEDELNLVYELEWTEEMAKLGLNQQLCHEMGVGRPKGKTMLAQHIVFTVLNERGLKVAYWGTKGAKSKFHHTFNPESYLYNYQRCDPTQEVWIVQDMFECLRLIYSGKQAVCNFNLPYISTKQYILLSNFERVVIQWEGDKRNVAYSNILSLKTFYRFA